MEGAARIRRSGREGARSATGYPGAPRHAIRNRSAGNAGRISGSADRDTHKTPVTSSSSSLSNMCARSRSEMLLDEELGSRRALPKSEGLEPCEGDSPAQTPSAVFLCDYGPDGGFFQVKCPPARTAWISFFDLPDS